MPLMLLQAAAGCGWCTRTADVCGAGCAGLQDVDVTGSVQHLNVELGQLSTTQMCINMIRFMVKI